MALKKNKVKFGLTNVYYARITGWSVDGTPVYEIPVRLPGAVNLSIDANGEADNFYADNSVYYVINNNAGYSGDLEIALVPTEFATNILGEVLDGNGVLAERNDSELTEFALAFEFSGDKNKIRHWMYRCSASRPKTESSTTEESTEVKTETLSIKAAALPNGFVKSKTCESTEESVYLNWFKNVYYPSVKAKSTVAATTTKE